MSMTKQNLILVALLIGIVQVVGYYLSAILSGSSGLVPIAQPDTLLYCQAARRIAEGAPFSYSAGTLPSTGTTSVLYPFVLAIPYALGATGASLISAGFWLNGFFYLVFILGWVLAADCLMENQPAKLTAVISLAIFGQPAYSAFSQCDIGFWMAVSAMLAYALLANRFWLLAVMLLISPWVRPEGLFCGMAFFFVSFVTRKLDRRGWILLFAWLASALGVFVLNYLLSGHVQFSSVADKGYFKQYSFAVAVHATLQDALEMMRDVLMGQTGMIPRGLISFPVVGALLLALGVNAHDWKRSESWRLIAWLLAVGLGFLSVAQSGWQGTNMDRYCAWLLPAVIVLCAEGVVYLSGFCKQTCVARLVPCAWIGFLLVSSVGYLAIFSWNTRTVSQLEDFSKACEAVLPKGASIGCMGECGIAYYMSPRRVAHLAGIYSPEFRFMGSAARFEDLKRNPSKRFSYWIFNDEFSDLRNSAFGGNVFGSCVLAGPGPRALHQADWTAYDEADKAPRMEPGERLSDRVDVGYPDDETRSGYEVIDRYSRRPAAPFSICARMTDSRIIADSGRVIVGGDAMNVTLVPGVDVRVVMRIAAQGSSSIADGVASQTLNGKIPETFSMNIAVDGTIVEKVTLPCDQKWFSDVSFAIPGSAIKNPVSRIAFLGDHIPFGYWFIQKAE